MLLWSNIGTSGHQRFYDANRRGGRVVAVSEAQRWVYGRRRGEDEQQCGRLRTKIHLKIITAKVTIMAPLHAEPTPR